MGLCSLISKALSDFYGLRKLIEVLKRRSIGIFLKKAVYLLIILAQSIFTTRLVTKSDERENYFYKSCAKEPTQPQGIPMSFE